MFTYEIIKNLIHSSGQLFEELVQVYGMLPETTCRRRGQCCAMLPEMTFVEALSAFRCLANFEPEMQNRLFQKLVAYFFSNAMEITSCPFLEGNTCLIYEERFFGCRAYGLWSPGYYEKRSGANQKAKKDLQANWQRLGVSLPSEVMGFHQPYCLDVKIQNNAAMDDAMLEELGDRIETISESHGDENRIFIQTYFSDISYLAAALVFGTNQAVQIKFTTVRDTLGTGDPTLLERILAKLPDLHALS